MGSCDPDEGLFSVLIILCWKGSLLLNTGEGIVCIAKISTKEGGPGFWATFATNVYCTGILPHKRENSVCYGTQLPFTQFFFSV
jgi:hypothetical protein